MRKALGIVGLAVVATALPVSGATAADTVRPPDSIWRTAGAPVTVPATTYCWTRVENGQPTEGICVDAAPLDCARATDAETLWLPARRRARIRVSLAFMPRMATLIRKLGSPDAKNQTLTPGREVTFRVAPGYEGGLGVFVTGPKPGGGTALYPVCVRRR